MHGNPQLRQWVFAGLIAGFRQIVLDKLKEIPACLAQDELAYLALTGKIELPVTNKLAWLLQLWAPSNGLAVTREWASQPGKHVDIAVLRGSHPEELLELKAMVTSDPIRETKTRERSFVELKNDIGRWRDGYQGTEVLGILLATHPKNEVPIEWIKSRTVKYADGVTKALKILKTESDVKLECERRVREFFRDSEIGSVVIPAGRCFDTGVEILAWLIGGQTHR